MGAIEAELRRLSAFALRWRLVGSHPLEIAIILGPAGEDRYGLRGHVEQFPQSLHRQKDTASRVVFLELIGDRQEYAVIRRFPFGCDFWRQNEGVSSRPLHRARQGVLTWQVSNLVPEV